jgi:hypothetical protein
VCSPTRWCRGARPCIDEPDLGRWRKRCSLEELRSGEVHGGQGKVNGGLTSGCRWRRLGHRGTAQDDEAYGPDDVDEGGRTVAVNSERMWRKMVTSEGLTLGAMAVGSS